MIKYTLTKIHPQFFLNEAITRSNQIMDYSASVSSTTNSIISIIIAYDLKNTIYKAKKRLEKGKPNVFD